MAEVSLVKVAMALGLGLLLALGVGFFLSHRAETCGAQGLFRVFFLTLLCVYALGFATRYVLIELLP